MNISDLNSHINAAFDAAVIKPLSVPAVVLDDVTTLQTMTYKSSKGDGFLVLCTTRFGKRAYTRIRNSGPDTWQEHDWPIAKMRDDLAKDYQASIDAGIAINGITLAAQDGDKAAFTQLITLLREAEELQPSDEAREAFRASPVTITDRAGNPHSMSVQEVRGLIVQYGLQLNELWVNYAKNRAVIAAS